MKKSVQEKDKEQEREIIRKFQKAQIINIIITMVSLFMLPLIAIGGLLAEQRELAIEKPLQYLCISLIGVMFLSNVFLRKCHNCGVKLK
ncbi:hypothetical protein [Anaeromicrobium sediminis]|uniref:Uncharacterized protein n=1 Tax=Anaeromicrobium sediminis TaxID=1478221 RepID=A0A267MCF1_9FIRM|nr:hypothetical protein [Anaeromicrobium sediminis]PAB56490.1 hypothetical protein CCE28_20690 [Anaeromicrobium sediminis]